MYARTLKYFSLFIALFVFSYSSISAEKCDSAPNFERDNSSVLILSEDLDRSNSRNFDHNSEVTTPIYTGSLQAMHIVGGELFYEWNANGDLEIYLEVFRDCQSGLNNAPFDSVAWISVFDRNPNGTSPKVTRFNFGIFLRYGGEGFFGMRLDTIIEYEGNEDCFVDSKEVCVTKGIYTIVLPFSTNPTFNLRPDPNFDGFVFAYRRCCRNRIIENILSNPLETGMTLRLDMTEEAYDQLNSQPIWPLVPPLYICANQDMVLDFSALDPEGNRLKYTLFDPFIGGTSMNSFFMNGPPDPPYDNVVWLFDRDSLFGPGSYLAIDTLSGQLTIESSSPGTFLLGVLLSEYDGNDNLISTRAQEFQITVRECRETQPMEDSIGLVRLYESTGGDNWTENVNWLSTEPIGNWYGIRTIAQGCVKRIELADNNLIGLLPTLELESLDTLILSDNSGLSGNISNGLLLTSVKYLDLSNNSFFGSIPDAVGRMMNLSNLDLSSNQFSESIPPDIGDLCELEELNLSNNDFEGELPIELTELFNLQIGAVNFSNNRIDSIQSKIIFFCPYGLEILENNPAYPDFVEICERTCSRSEFGNLTDHPWLVDTINSINCDTSECGGNEVIAEAGFVNVRGVEILYVRSGCYTVNNEFTETITLYDCDGNIVDTTFCESNAGCSPFSVTSEEQFADLEYDIRWTCECDSAYCIERDTIVIETGLIDTIEIGEVLHETLTCDPGMYSLSSVNNELPGEPPVVTEDNIGFTYELLTENLISGQQCTTTIAVVRGSTGRNEYEKLDPNSPVMIACHPNPVVDFLRCPDIDMVNVEEHKVFNIQGMEMPKYFQDYKDKLQLNVQEYPAGMYILVVKTKDRQYLNRFTVIR